MRGGKGMQRKEDLIAAILDKELEMFLKVPTVGPARCQESPEGFRLARGAMFEAWSERTLSFYLQHLRAARAAGRNLMAEKYARMQKLIPPPNDSDLIDDILEIEVEWQKQLQKKYPHAIGQGRRDDTGSALADFATYLRSELETYSTDVLASYADRMFQKLGYSLLDEAEQALSRRA